MSIPEKNVSLKGESYIVDGITRIDRNGTITVQTKSPPETGYNINIYNQQEQVAYEKFAVGNATVTFDMTGFATGSYMLTLRQSGVTRSVQPIIIRGYSISLTAPETVSGDAFRVTGAVNRLSTGTSIDHIDVVLANETTTIRRTATQTEGLYRATLPTGSLAPGTYTVYATVRGDTEVYGRLEPLGISDKQQIQIKRSTQQSPADTQPVQTVTVSPGHTTASPPESQTEPTRTAPTTGAEIVISLNTTTRTTTGSGPGFGAVLALVALGVVAVFARRTNR